jgi:hypothetical protein
MIRNTALALVACASLCLAGCATAGGGLFAGREHRQGACDWLGEPQRCRSVGGRGGRAWQAQGRRSRHCGQGPGQGEDALQAADAAYRGAAGTTDPGIQIAIASAAVAEITLIVSGAK